MRGAAIGLGVALALGSGSARADEPPLGAAPAKVEWREEWPRVTIYEIAAGAAMTAGSFLAESHIPEPDRPRWRGGIPVLDDGMRGLLRGRTRELQAATTKVSDLTFRIMAFAPYALDVGLGALALNLAPDVAWQLAVLDLDALTASGITQLVASKEVARERPYVHDCVNGGTITKACGGTNDNKSFFSGHAAGAFASAGLLCVTHQNLPLYGGGAIEGWVCAWALSVATLTGVFRVVADAHWSSDVLAGAGLGWLFGYVSPRFFHFRPRSGLAVRPTVRATDGGVLFGLGGSF